MLCDFLLHIYCCYTQYTLYWPCPQSFSTEQGREGRLRWRICQSARLSPLLTWVQFPLGTTYDSYVKRVSQRSAESRGFSPGTPVSSHKEC